MLQFGIPILVASRSPVVLIENAGKNKQMQFQCRLNELYSAIKNINFERCSRVPKLVSSTFPTYSQHVLHFSDALPQFFSMFPNVFQKMLPIFCSKCIPNIFPTYSQHIPNMFPNDPTFSEKAMSPQGPEKMLRLTLALMVTTALGRGEHFLGKADSQIRKAVVNKPRTKIMFYRFYVYVLLFIL